MELSKCQRPPACKEKVPHLGGLCGRPQPLNATANYCPTLATARLRVIAIGDDSDNDACNDDNDNHNLINQFGS